MGTDRGGVGQEEGEDWDEEIRLKIANHLLLSLFLKQSSTFRRFGSLPHEHFFSSPEKESIR